MEDIDAVVFDVIGTLVDEHAAVAAAAERLAAATGLDTATGLRERWVAGLDRRMEAVVAGTDAWRPHRELVTDAAEEAVAELGGRWSDAAAAVAGALDSAAEAWPDVAAATSALRRDRLVAALSNADLDALARLAHANAISWDVVLSTGAVRTFKPAPEAYRYAIETLRLEPARTLFVACHPWDLRAAATHGFRTAYVARPGAEPPAPDDRFDVHVEELTAL